MRPGPAVLATKMVTAAANSKQGYEAVEKWIQRMEEGNFKPGNRQYTDMIKCAGRAGDIEAAESLAQFVSFCVCSKHFCRARARGCGKDMETQNDSSTLIDMI